MGNSVSQQDLQKYALKKDIQSSEFLKNEDLDKLDLIYQTRGNYALSKDLELIYQTRGNYVLSSDLASYAKNSDLANYQTQGNYALISDLIGYAKNSDLDNYQTRGNYVLSSDLDNYQPKGDYALKSEISANQDLSKYALKTELPVVPANIATKGDLANYQPKGDYALQSQISAQQDLSKYVLKGDNTLELKDSKGNSNAPFIKLNNSGGGAGNQVGIKLNPWSGRSGGDSSQIIALDDGAASSHLLFYTAPAGEGSKSTERMRIKNDGEVEVKGKLTTNSLTIGGTDLKPSNFATKGDLANYQPKGNYALKSDIQAGNAELPAGLKKIMGYTLSPYKTYKTPYNGSNYTKVANTTFDICKDTCTKNTKCVGFQFPSKSYNTNVNGECFTFSSTDEEKYDKDVHIFYKTL